MTQASPYASFVIVGRNDDYGGDFTGRLRLAVRWLDHLAAKHQLPSELVLVNYNPIPGKPDLPEVIAGTTGRGFLSVRMITVPPEVHLDLIRPEVRKTVPLFEFIAKNVGIRRARGEFVVSTNADILFSEGLIELMAERALEKGVLYRCDRYDFSFKKREDAKIGFEQLETLIRERVSRFFLQGGTFWLPYPRSVERRLAFLAWYQSARSLYYSTLLKVPGSRYFFGVPRIRAEQWFILQHHLNACGDFALMSRDDWMNDVSYPEDTWISTHTDSLHLISALVSGLRIEVAPFPVYHQHHRRRFDFGVRDPDMNRMFERLLEEGNQMLDSGESVFRQPENWGLGDLDLSEQLLG